MAVAEPRHDPSAEADLPVGDPFREFVSEVDRRDESNPLLDCPSPIAVTPPSYMLTGISPASNGRWFIGTVVLGVGLAVGFAGGVALVTPHSADDTTSTPRIAGDRAGAEPSRAAIQPPVDPSALVDHPSPQFANPTNDQPTNNQVPPTEGDSPTLERKPVTIGERSSVMPPTADADRAVARLYVQSRPAGADVYLDEQFVSTTPFQLSGVIPGRHTIRIDLQGYRTWSAPLDVERGAHIRIGASLER